MKEELVNLLDVLINQNLHDNLIVYLNSLITDDKLVVRMAAFESLKKISLKTMNSKFINDVFVKLESCLKR